MSTNQIPREKFVLGEGSYNSWPSFETRVSADAFEIVPAPMPVGWLIPAGLFVVIFTSLMAYGFAKEDSYVLAFVMVLLGLFTVVLIVAQHQPNRPGGVIFRFDRKTGQISLPDRNLTFGEDCRLSFAFITSPIHSPEKTREESVAELQLVVQSSGQTSRYSIAQAMTRYALKSLVADVHRHVGLPIHEIEHSGFLQPKVYEKMFGQD